MPDGAKISAVRTARPNDESMESMSDSWTMREMHLVRVRLCERKSQRVAVIVRKHFASTG